MFKELLTLFRSNDAIAQMGKDFEEMLAIARDLIVRAGKIFWDEVDGEEAPVEISKRDVTINKLERSVRRQVITHLTLTSSRRDVPYGLLLMSLVKDVERIGDYAKNLAEVRTEGGAPVPHDAQGDELRAIRTAVEEALRRSMGVFSLSDSAGAAELMAELRGLNRRCDDLIARVARGEYDAATTTTLVLGARYYKRIGSHVLNILSGIVMPLHKLDYYDEDQLELDPGDDD